jgi:hypothetical protein
MVPAETFCAIACRGSCWVLLRVMARACPGSTCERKAHRPRANVIKRPQPESLAGPLRLRRVFLISSTTGHPRSVRGRRDRAVADTSVPVLPAIKRLDVVARAGAQEFLNASECGDIQSLGPLAHPSRLRLLYLYGTTRIRDGALTPWPRCCAWGDFRMQSRREYRPSVRELQDLLAQRHRW